MSTVSIDHAGQHSVVPASSSTTAIQLKLDDLVEIAKGIDSVSKIPLQGSFQASTLPAPTPNCGASWLYNWRSWLLVSSAAWLGVICGRGDGWSADMSTRNVTTMAVSTAGGMSLLLLIWQAVEIYCTHRTLSQALSVAQQSPVNQAIALYHQIHRQLNAGSYYSKPNQLRQETLNALLISIEHSSPVIKKELLKLSANFCNAMGKIYYDFAKQIQGRLCRGNFFEQHQRFEQTMMDLRQQSTDLYLLQLTQDMETSRLLTVWIGEMLIDMKTMADMAMCMHVAWQECVDGQANGQTLQAARNSILAHWIDYEKKRNEMKTELTAIYPSALQLALSRSSSSASSDSSCLPSDIHPSLTMCDLVKDIYEACVMWCSSHSKASFYLNKTDLPKSIKHLQLPGVLPENYRIWHHSDIWVKEYIDYCKKVLSAMGQNLSYLARLPSYNQVTLSQYIEHYPFVETLRFYTQIIDWKNSMQPGGFNELLSQPMAPYAPMLEDACSLLEMKLACFRLHYNQVMLGHLKDYCGSVHFSMSRDTFLSVYNSIICMLPQIEQVERSMPDYAKDLRFMHLTAHFVDKVDFAKMYLHRLSPRNYQNFLSHLFLNLDTLVPETAIPEERPVTLAQTLMETNWQFFDDFIGHLKQWFEEKAQALFAAFPQGESASSLGATMYWQEMTKALEEGCKAQCWFFFSKHGGDQQVPE